MYTYLGLGVCVAIKPEDESEILLGLDTGWVFQVSMSCPTFAVIHYPAHTASVRTLEWNAHHQKVFISCSLDWTVKVWLEHHM